MLNATWILVSDASRARIFEDRGLVSGLVERGGYACPGGREHLRDRVSDRARLKGGGSQGIRAGILAERNPKDHEAEVFARFLADQLLRQAHQQAFDHLVLVAPPHFLGLLRASLDEGLAKRVVATFDKDLTLLDAQELSRRIHAPVR